jgi:hypothetical protein
MDIDTVQSVIQSNFMRSYKENKELKEKYDSLPDSAKHLMDAMKRTTTQTKLTDTGMAKAECSGCPYAGRKSNEEPCYCCKVNE